MRESQKLISSERLSNSWPSLETRPGTAPKSTQKLTRTDWSSIPPHSTHSGPPVFRYPNDFENLPRLLFLTFFLFLFPFIFFSLFYIPLLLLLPLAALLMLWLGCRRHDGRLSVAPQRLGLLLLFLFLLLSLLLFLLYPFSSMAL